jgi:hypothetical protein
VTAEAGAQLALDMGRDRKPGGIGFPPDGKPGLEMLLHEAVERDALWVATTVGPRRAGTVRAAGLQ